MSTKFKTSEESIAIVEPIMDVIFGMVEHPIDILHMTHAICKCTIESIPDPLCDKYLDELTIEKLAHTLLAINESISQLKRLKDLELCKQIERAQKSHLPPTSEN